jgi:hypothetical protein
MAAKNGVSQEEQDDSDIGRHKWTETERGHYGQALREGWVRQPPPNAPRIVNVFL